MKFSLVFLALLVVVLTTSVEVGARRGGSSSRGSSSRGSSSTSRGSSSKGSSWGWGSKSKSKSKTHTVNYGSTYKKPKSKWSNVKKAAIAGYTVYKGRKVVGKFRSFGKPKRWSLHGGRSYFFAGHGMHGYGYHRGYHGYRRRDDDDDDDFKGVSPWGVMWLVLFGINSCGFVAWLGTYCYLKRH